MVRSAHVHANTHAPNARMLCGGGERALECAYVRDTADCVLRVQATQEQERVFRLRVRAQFQKWIINPASGKHLGKQRRTPHEPTPSACLRICNARTLAHSHTLRTPHPGWYAPTTDRGRVGQLFSIYRKNNQQHVLEFGFCCKRKQLQ